MRIIVTGATGFIGRNLVAGLVKDRHDLLATGRSTAVGRELEELGAAFRPADLRDEAEVRSAFAPADLVVHCGAKSGPWGSLRDHYQANVVGTRNVASACRHHGVPKMVFISTPSVYFTGRDRFDIREDEPLPRRPRTAYAKTKRIAEAELAGLAPQGLEVITLRPRAVHGPFDTIFVPRLLRMARQPSPPLVGGGGAWAEVTWVGNLVDAVRRCLEAPAESWNQAYNITNGEPITVRDFFGGLAQAFDLPFCPRPVSRVFAGTVATLMELSARLPGVTSEPVMTRTSVDYLATSMTMSIAKARERLGYRPEVGNTEGFRRTAEWFRAVFHPALSAG